MGTRGAYGFYKDGIEKVTYNHFDSYPDGLGRDILQFIQETSIEEMNKIFNKILLVDEDKGIPSTPLVKKYRKYSDISVASQSSYDWYCLLRKAQGDLFPYKDDLEHMIDGKDFLKDSLFCEYAYIINLDTNQLEFYVGFNRKENANGRYAKFKNDEYYGVELLGNFDLSEIQKTKDIDEVNKATILTIVLKMEHLESKNRGRNDE